MSVQQFCLRWNNHQPNFISVCSSLLHNGTLVDVTLAAEGNQLQAHKIVLSACSSYFQSLFTMNPCQHPIVILKDVQYDHLRTMVDFMYYGEVNVSQDQLPHILKTAEMLKIKGLAEMPTDPANLMRSDSKSATDSTELVGTGPNTSTQTTSTGSGASTNNNGTGLVNNNNTGLSSTIWSSSESQFHTQQQQPQQHQSQQTAQHQTQTQQHHQHIQQQQQQQHHNQQQQHQHQGQQQQLHTQLQNSHTQIPHQQQQQQQHHHHHQQIRRTPSPLGAGSSPAARRKRIRKSSNNGSGERNNPDDQHSTSVEAGGPSAGGLTLSQMSQMSFAGGGGTANSSGLGSLATHSIHTSKLLKETVNNDMETQPQDSDSLDDAHGGHVHIQIKPEVDITGMQQSIPLDISGATTPSEHDAPNTQSAHSESRYTTFVRTESVTEEKLIQREQDDHHRNLEQQEHEEEQQQHSVQMGSKRNRVLIRQPRVKRDSDSLSSHVSPEPTPITSNTNPTDGRSLSGIRIKEASDGNSEKPHENTNQAQALFVNTPGHHRQHHLLTIPPRIERHSSEPAPLLSPSSPNLLNVPQNSPFLIKQHSDPLPPTHHQYATAGHLTSVNIGSVALGDPSRISCPNTEIITNPFAPLHRQYSHPLANVATVANYVTISTPLQSTQHISLPEAIYVNTSPPPVGSTQYIVPAQTVHSVYNVTTTTDAPVNSNVTTAMAKVPSVTVSEEYCVDNSAITDSTKSAISCKSSLATNPKYRFARSYQTATTNMTSSSSSSTSGNKTSISSSSFEQVPHLKVRGEELQRSVSSPQTSREMITLVNPRSSHCPVIRPGPALGCNFCWNTIDGHGRILRRKTKYHCPECQTNLCIVPCFQEYHERLNTEATTSRTNNTTTKPSSVGGSSFALIHYSSNQAGHKSSRHHYGKTESI